jgi:Tfp pilus assembly protein PilN
MRIDLNLARRPLRNDPAFFAGYGLAGLLVLVLTLYNGCATGSYLLLTARARDQIDSAQVMTQAYQQQIHKLQPRLTARLDPTLLREAHLIRDLILRRTFSWTLLFNQLEQVAPDSVLLTAVQPRVEGGVVQLTITGKAKTADGWRQLIDALERADAFAQAYPDNRVLKDGEVEFRLRVRYLPERAAARSGQRNGDRPPANSARVARVPA